VTAVLCISIAALLWALASSLRLLRRSGEVRVGLATGLVGLQALGAGALLAATRGQALGLDATSAAVLATLGAAIASVFVVRSYGSTLEELDLAEALHWGSMQGVRAVTQLAAEQRGELEDRIGALLELGCERFGLEIGFLSHIEGDVHEIRALHAPSDFPLAVGATLPLAATLCRLTIAAERPVAVEQISATAWVEPSDGDPLGFEAYLGAVVATGGRPFGTLVFCSRSAQTRRFTASHKDLLALMAQWAGVEIERREALRASTRTPEVGATAAPAEAPRRARTRRASIDLNEVLRRVEARIRDLVGPRIQLVVRASSEPVLARLAGVPPESLLLTLVGHAIDAMQGAGTLTLASERVAGDPARWVTLSIAHTGRGPRAEDLARAFAPGRDPGPDALALASLLRALRRGGGDLSVEVDPARGSTFTVFLPAVARAIRAPGLPRAAVAAPPPPPPGN
jgi:signal transduction histidine kinase